MSDEVLAERRDGVLVITINRPEARNALNGAVAAGRRRGARRARRGRRPAGRRPHRRGRHVLLRHGPQGVPARRDARRSRAAGWRHHPEPAAQAAHRRRRGLGPGRRLRAAARLRPDRRRRGRAVRRARGEARRWSPPAARALRCPGASRGDRPGAAAHRRPDRRAAAPPRSAWSTASTPEGGALDGALALAATIAANGPLAVAATKQIARGRRATGRPSEGWDEQARGHRAGVLSRGRAGGRDRVRREARAPVEEPLTAPS